MSFDVDNEQIRVMPIPLIPEEWSERRFRYFGESRGHLHLVEIYGSLTIQFCVYEMERDYSGWFPKYQVDLSSVVAPYPEMRMKRLNPMHLHYYSFSILCIVEEEDDEKSYLVLHIPKKVIRYNFKDRSFKMLHDFCPPQSSISKDPNSLQFQCFDAYQFIPALACV